jgi:hypothetical protein
LVAGFLAVALLASLVPRSLAEVTREEVERAIRDGLSFLRKQQRADGSWPDYDSNESHTGSTSLVTLALLTAGESPESDTVARALRYLRQFGPNELNNTYSVALQTMVFAAADPARYKVMIARNAEWLKEAQIKPGDRFDWPGSWTYSSNKNFHGDSSNTQYALLGLNAAAEAGIPIDPKVWTLARSYWEDWQRADGSWPYRPGDHSRATASMACAGISSLIITGMKRYQGREFLANDTIQNCGKGGFNPKLQAGIDWLSAHFSVDRNDGQDQTWKFYYLYGLERAGRLTGLRFFGNNDWYRRGAEELVHDQDRVFGSWEGTSVEQNKLIATSFALLFLAKGRAPVVMNKLRHGPSGDWNNDPDDVRNLVNVVSRDWKHLLTWQMVDPNTASVEELLQAKIAFITGHEAPVFTDVAKQNLREFVEQGGFIFADACCSRPEFDQGFRALMKEIFPESEYKLRELAPEHPVWRAKYELNFKIHPLYGIEHGCRTVVIYTPEDLSCYWNQCENFPTNPSVIKALRVGQNVIDYATGRELPADKLAVHKVADFRSETPKRGALQIAKLRHAGDWNVAPLAIPNLTATLHEAPLRFDVVINHREILPSDPNLIHYPLLYIHGRAALSFSKEDLVALRKHLDPGGGTIFADAACGSTSFDAAFRKFMTELLPSNPLEPIPRDDEIYTQKVGFDLSDVQYTKAAGGGRDLPQLEGVKLNGRWAIIYSKYDIGCALERHQGLDCKGYAHESALKIAANIVLYATRP